MKNTGQLCVQPHAFCPLSSGRSGRAQPSWQQKLGRNRVQNGTNRSWTLKKNETEHRTRLKIGLKSSPIRLRARRPRPLFSRGKRGYISADNQTAALKIAHINRVHSGALVDIVQINNFWKLIHWSGRKCLLGSFCLSWNGLSQWEIIQVIRNSIVIHQWFLWSCAPNHYGPLLQRILLEVPQFITLSFQ